MQLRIDHQLCYRYDRPVFFEPMLLRLCPRHDHIQQLLDFDLHIHPAPAGSASILDANDNRAQVAWFNGTHDELQIRSTARLRMHAGSAFKYLLTDASAEQLPVAYADALQASLAVYREQAAPDPAVEELAGDLQRQAMGQTVEFLRRLVLHIPNHCTQIHREEGAPWPAGDTLARGEGSCRDLTLLFMALARQVGLAARFVSGYCSIEALDQANELHAWAEVYLPGGGWRGYDPTLGMATEHEHIALATAADSAHAAPTQGNYRGTDALSRFEYAIQIQPEGD